MAGFTALEVWAMASDKESALEFIDEVFNKHKVDDSERFFTPGFVEHNPWPGYPATVQGFKDGTAAFLAAFPDCRCEVDEVLSDGDKLVVRSRIMGTNSGSFMGMPPTGKSVEIEGIDIVRMENGRLAEHWGIFDAATMMQQMGLMPQPTAAV